MSYTTNSSIIRQDQARFMFSINNFPEAKIIKKNGENIISESFSILASKFVMYVYPSGCRKEDSEFVTIFLANMSDHKVTVSFTFTVRSKVNSVKSQVIESKSIWGWYQFIKISEVGQNLEIAVDVTVEKEEIIDGHIGGMSLAERQFMKKNEPENQQKLELMLKQKLDENHQKLEIKLEQELENKLEQKLDEKLDAKLNQMDQKINLKFEDLKINIRAPECPICFEELRPPTRIIQCLKGHKLCEPCSNKPEISSCPGGCKAGFIGRDFGMEAFLLEQFQIRRQ